MAFSDGFRLQAAHNERDQHQKKEREGPPDPPRTSTLARIPPQGQKVTCKPSLRLNPAPPPAGLRYHNWKLRGLLAGMVLAGLVVKFRV